MLFFFFQKVFGNNCIKIGKQKIPKIMIQFIWLPILLLKANLCSFYLSSYCSHLNIVYKLERYGSSFFNLKILSRKSCFSTNFRKCPCGLHFTYWDSKIVKFGKTVKPEKMLKKKCFKKVVFLIKLLTKVMLNLKNW